MARSPVILLANRTLPNVDAIATTLESGLSDIVEFLPSDSDQATLAIAIGGLSLIHI